ncbi:MAG TPA: GNAT family N-acetyltransferase [Candidatus Acidoferrales bacterium]|nr:GNAT family N-acetyltransferase [Candidatus Acidoferrales bacterium]
MKTTFKLETEHLLLLPWRAEDWLQLRPIAQDPEVMRYISNGEPWTDERIRELVDRQISGFEQRGFCFWRLLHKPGENQNDAGEMMGFCGLQPLDGTREIEIGWWLGRSWWGKGLATEAARAAMRDGFDRARLDRIVAIAQPENRASIHVIEKLGMLFERETTHRGFRVAMYSIERKPPSAIDSSSV